MNALLRRPAIFDRFPGLAAAESTRHGGISPAPYHSLNLGKSTGDAPENVAENRRRFCVELGFEPDQLAWSKQVHGDLVWSVTAPGGSEGFDALITTSPGILLTISVADCVPVLIFDSKNQAIAAIHAGWRGTVAGIVSKTVERMAQEFGTRAADCLGYIGTCIDECSFEVGEEVAEAFDGAFKHWDAARGKFLIDLKKANAEQLYTLGMPPSQVEISPWSTVLNNADYFSHRLENGMTGRMMAAVGLFL